MRCLLVLFFVSLPLMGAQDSETDSYKSGVLVLKNGLVVAIRGDYEVIDQEVHFTDSKGRYLTLPLKQVDLAESRRRNEKQAYSRSSAGEREGSEYDPALKREGGPEIYIPSQPFKPETLVESSQGLNDLFPEDMDWDWSLKDLDQEEIKQKFEDFSTRIGISFVIFLGLLLLGYLTSFFTHLYIIYTAFRDGSWWGLALLLTYLGPWVLGFMDISSNLLFSSGLSLFHFVLLLIYIIINCHGSKFKYLFLLLLPWVITLAYILVLIVKVTFF